jgi:RimJ/RimL family protein N-acetyltransferase
MNFGREIETITVGSAAIDVFLVPWDSEIFGFPVAQIERLVAGAGNDLAEAMRRLRSWLDKHRIRLASCRLDSRALRESMLLEANGFRFVEMVYSPVLSPVIAPGAADEELAIEPAGADDLAAIEAVAGAAFETGRFKLDFRIDPAASDRRYRVWVRNSFADPRQQVLKATVAGDLVGFFIVEGRPDRSAYWHLTAIAPTHQGKGIGRRLWAAMVRRHFESGASRVETTISAHNPPVMNIYAALGFRFGAPRMTLHWVRE